MGYSEVNEMAELENEIRELKNETLIYKAALNKIACGGGKFSKLVATEALTLGEV